MVSLTIENLDDGLVSRLRSRANSHGQTVEEELADIISKALDSEPKNWGQHLLDTIRSELGPLGGLDIDIPPREFDRDPPRFDR